MDPQHFGKEKRPFLGLPVLLHDHLPETLGVTSIGSPWLLGESHKHNLLFRGPHVSFGMVFGDRKAFESFEGKTYNSIYIYCIFPRTFLSA